MFRTVEKYYKKTYAFAFMGCIAVLPMSDTIALRNIFLAIMLLLIFSGLISSPGIRQDFTRGAKLIPLPVVLWISYLCVFPLWAQIPETAWANLKGQWGESIVAWFVGFGAAVLFAESRLSLWQLGLASVFPILVHLLLACFAYIGFFSSEYYGHADLGGLLVEVMHWVQGEFKPDGRHYPMRDGFLGIETQPGNIGYASSVAISIFTTLFLIGKRTSNISEMIKAAILVVLCFLSILIARTRGGLLFGILMIVLVSIFEGLVVKSQSEKDIKSKFFNESSPFRNLIICAVIFTLGGLTYLGTKADPRWSTMVDKVKIGFSIADPIASLCHGISPEEELAIRNRLAPKPPSYIQEVIDGVKGQDGGRVILMRAGIQLVLNNPFGLDGSRQSYEQLIRSECGGAPKLYFANAHNSWIDLALGLGGVGVILFLLMLFNFLRYSLTSIVKIDNNPCARLVGVLAAFWIIRGFFDSLYREHYLQMQGLVISYLYISAIIHFRRGAPAYK